MDIKTANQKLLDLLVKTQNWTKLDSGKLTKKHGVVDLYVDDFDGNITIDFERSPYPYPLSYMGFVDGATDDDIEEKLKGIAAFSRDYQPLELPEYL